MAIPRMHLVDETCSNLYHCISRTVRQAFLLAPPPDGMVDHHRCDWVVERVRFLSEIFAIDCVSLAVMSNHLHLLLRTLPEVVESWSAFEIGHRWLSLRPPRMLRRLQGIDPDAPPQEREIELLVASPQRIATLRGRLSSLPWYMKELKEHIARRVNREERRTGAFWEERYKSIAVLDDIGIQRCATYIDLNPVAAGMVDEPMLARHTSIGELARSGVGLECPSDADGRRAARDLWRALLAQAGGEWDSEARPAGGSGDSSDSSDSSDDASAEARRNRDLDAFIASFDGIRFHPALPARRQPHHPRGVAADDESIEAVPVLGRPRANVQAAASDATGADASAAASAEGQVSTASQAQTSIDGEDARDRAHSHAASEHAPCPQERAEPSAASCATKDASRLDSLPLPPPRQARHRRVPPDEHLLDITMGEHLRRLRRLALLGQERGRAKGTGRFRRRTPMEIELALGREADDRGIAALFKELSGEGEGESAAEIAELLSGLMGTARHFGTAIGSKAALAAEAARRGRKRVIAALRTEVPQRRGAGASAMSSSGAGGSGVEVGAGSSTRGDPAMPRAG